MNKEEFNVFFKSYSKNVDNANRHGFWKLSDEIIEQIIKNNIPKNISKDSIILDAGGGTGRWICKLSKIYKSRFILCDLSKYMLKQAKKNIEKAKIVDRVYIVNNDLTSIKNIKSGSVDYIISIYNPISFINKKQKALKELFRILKFEGKVIIMGQGCFNAIASKMNNYCVSAKELKELEQKKLVRWTKSVPKLNVFTKESLETNLIKAGFKVDKSYGVPVFVQPGVEDFDPQNIKKSKISKALENKNFFEMVFEVEMKYNNWSTVVNRGMNIITVASKNS